MSARMIGVDVGGTFTDVFVLDEATGTANVAKVPTSRPDQSGGFLSGISQANDRTADLSEILSRIRWVATHLFGQMTNDK